MENIQENATQEVAKKERVKLTPEEAKANRAASAKKTAEKRKAKGIAAKQFFIHKSLFKKAEEIMAPILEESKALTDAE